MDIRKDFRTASTMLNRLVQYAKVFGKYNESWSHYKNNEDFSKIYGHYSWEEIKPLEDLYREGRQFSLFMYEILTGFNYPEKFPTLTSYINNFENDFLKYIENIRDIPIKAQKKADELNCNLYSISQMIDLFYTQFEYIEQIRKAFNSLKDTEIYRIENGLSHSNQCTSVLEILNAIDRVGKMFERLPNTHIDKDEEALRDQIVASLGSFKKGSASGETLNNKGKTDILFRENDENIFIGECKFWRGEKSFLNTITQLLDYLTWRDNQAGVIIFVPNKDFLSVKAKSEKIISQHPNYCTLLSNNGKWLSYEFYLYEHKSEKINISVMLYHTPR